MATNGFSFEELTGPTVERKPAFVPAARTSKQKTGLTLDDVGGTSDKIGTLPKDRTIFETIRNEAKASGVPEEFLFALADQESGYNPKAFNSEFGAAGILQYIPETAKARGIDPSDPAASIRAAAQDFAKAMEEGGVDWAIKHHFAGPNVAGHGPKTRQYLADVTKRAQDIRALLDAGVDQEALEVGGSTEQGAKQVVGFSFEELAGPQEPASPQEKETGLLESLTPIANKAVQLQLENTAVIGQTLERSWNFIKDRFTDRPGEIRGQPVRRLKIDDKQIQNITNGMSPKDAERVASALSAARTTDIRTPSVKEESDKIKAKHTQARAVKGFIDNLDPPAKLMLQDSLPANLWETAINAPDLAYEKVEDATKIIQQYDIVRNPDRFPPQAVQAARRAIAQREVEEEGDGLGKMWEGIFRLAKDDPGGLAAQFVNAIVADPELLMAPEGIGVRLVSGVKKVATGGQVTSKAARVAENVVDAAGTEAALNLGIEAASAASEGRTLTRGEAKNAATLGAVFGGTLAGLGGIIGRGTKAVENIRAGKVGEADLQNALREAAEAEAVVDDVVNRPQSFDPELRQKIEEGLGIQNLSEADRKNWHTRRQRELAKTFREQSLDADYFNYLAEERITRRTQLAEEGEVRRAQQAAEAAKQQEIERAYQENQLARTQRFADEYEQALAAREQAKVGDEEAAAIAEDNLRTATKKLDEQEIMEAAFDGDVPAIRNAMLRATQRDTKLARPKWQRGDVDPRVLTHLGVGGLFAGTAFAVAPEEQKIATAFAAGLAGLVLPKGGSVLSRMRQAGAISGDGDLFVLARMVKDGKLKPTREIEEIKAREAELLNLARRGDQRAYKELFEENFPTAERYARKFVRGTDIDPADVAQEAFIKAFQNLEKFQGDSQFSTWLYSIVKNTAHNMRRDADTLKSGGEYDVVSAELPDVVSPYGERYSRDAFDEGVGAHLEDTPENQKIREESEAIIQNKLAQMTERKRKTFLLAKVEGHTAEEIAKLTDQNLSTVLMQLKSAQDEILEAVEKGFGAQKNTSNTMRVFRGLSNENISYNFDTAGFPSEGTGLYVSSDRIGAEPFGRVVEYEVDIPKRPLKVNTKDEPLPLLDSNEKYEEMKSLLTSPIKNSDSPWIRINKEAVQKTLKEFPNNYYEDLFWEFGKNITNVAKKYGYDAVEVTVPQGRKWYVLFDGHEKYKPIEKRGRGRPRKQAGEIDPALMKTGAKVALVGLAGLTAPMLFVDDKDAKGKIRPQDQYAKLISGSAAAGLAALALFSRGRGTRSLARATVDVIGDTFGSASTELLYKAPEVFGKLQGAIRSVSELTHKHISNTDPFIFRLSKLPEETQNILARALYTGKGAVIDKILQALGDGELIAGYKQVRATLDSLGDQLSTLKRITKGKFEYFPRIIRDRDGLFKAIGKEKSNDILGIMQQANIDSMRTNGRTLNELEENALINSILFGDKKDPLQPGWSKNRGIEEITPELLPFYATPAESLHTYIRSAVGEIEKAKFFGKFAQNTKKGAHEFLDVEASVGNLIKRDMEMGKLSAEEADKVADIIKSFYGKGHVGEPKLIKDFKDITNIGLLGNFWSAATQLADIATPIYTQDLRSTIAAVVRQATGRKLISSRELGLADIVSTEFAGQQKSTKWLNTALKVTLFNRIDQIGKNTAINAAIIRAKRLAQNDSGVAKLFNRYGEVYGDKFSSLVSDLKNGKITDLTKDYAWMELSRSQPISMLEMPLNYIKHPKFRSYLWLKSFTIKQIDMVRRDAIHEMKTGGPSGIIRGMRNLTKMAVVLGTAGAGTQMVKDWLLGKDVKFEVSDIPFNLIKNLGWSEYQLDKFKGVSREDAAFRRKKGDSTARARQAAPLDAMLDFVVPPYSMYQQILTGNPNAIRYLVPGIGPKAAQMFKDAMQVDNEAKEGK